MKAHPSTSNCQFCKNDLRKYDTFYDGNTNSGHWTWMCRECWKFNGLGIGIGIGQEYDSKTNEKLRG